ncbi:MAG: hypothetical protein WDA07_06430 [Leucobacter sp.]
MDRADVTEQAIKGVPPVAVVTADAVFGWTLNQMVMAATLIYVLLQIGFLLWKWRRIAKQDKVKISD